MSTYQLWLSLEEENDHGSISEVDLINLSEELGQKFPSLREARDFIAGLSIAPPALASASRPPHSQSGAEILALRIADEGFDEDALDDAVHLAYSDRASSINNQGWEKQCRTLLSFGINPLTCLGLDQDD